MGSRAELGAHGAVLAAAAVASAHTCWRLAREHAAVLAIGHEPAWAGALPVDRGDHQWNAMRGALLPYALMLAAHAVAGLLLWRSASRSVAGRMNARAVAAAIAMAVLHGTNSLKMAAVAAPAVLLARIPHRQTAVAATWVYGLGVILLLRPLERRWLPALGWAGAHADWTNTFNVAMLRAMSLALDRIHAAHGAAPMAHDAARCGECREMAQRASAAGIFEMRAMADACGIVFCAGGERNASAVFNTSAAVPAPVAAKYRSLEDGPEDGTLLAPPANSTQPNVPPSVVVHSADAEYPAAPTLSRGSPPVCVRERMSAAPPEPDEESVQAYWQTSSAAAVAYVFYPPLHIAGPIVSYNDFCWQVAHPPEIRAAYVWSYAAGLAVYLASLEAACHALMAFALRAAACAGTLALRPHEAAAVAVWNMALLFLKLGAFWRLSRLGALLDGLAPPENMARFFLNCPSAAGFWRAWHRSFNAWLLRYMYVPLGGRRRALLNAWPIFAFVALWHDPEAHLLVWAAAICALLVPEAIACAAAERWRLAEQIGPAAWRHAKAAAVAGNVLLMGAANAVGYVYGPGVVLRFFSGLAGVDALALPALLAVLFSLAHVQMAIRAREASMGIRLSY